MPDNPVLVAAFSDGDAAPQRHRQNEIYGDEIGRMLPARIAGGACGKGVDIGVERSTRPVSCMWEGIVGCCGPRSASRAQ